jgi:hypothetical protein
MSNSVLNDFLLYLQRNSPKSLQDRGVYCNVSNDKKRISFTYEQALADPANEIASICRGIIVASYVDIDIDMGNFKITGEYDDEEDYKSQPKPKSSFNEVSPSDKELLVEKLKSFQIG